MNYSPKPNHVTVIKCFPFNPQDSYTQVNIRNITHLIISHCTHERFQRIQSIIEFIYTHILNRFQHTHTLFSPSHFPNLLHAYNSHKTQSKLYTYFACHHNSITFKVRLSCSHICPKPVTIMQHSVIVISSIVAFFKHRQHHTFELTYIGSYIQHGSTSTTKTYSSITHLYIYIYTFTHQGHTST